MNNPWTEEFTDKVAKLWKEGHSAGVLAERFGLTRSSVAGKMNRLGHLRKGVLPKHRILVPYREPPKEARKHKARPAPSMPKVKEGKLSGELPTPQDAIIQPAAKTSKSKPGLLDLERDMCRWPYGHPKDRGFHFCGDVAQTGSSYCEEHHNNAYQEIRKNNG